MAQATGKTRVFVSFSASDLSLARDVARRLREAGLQPSLSSPAPVSGGARFRESLADTIKQSEAVLFLLTPAALRSAWNLFELGMADAAEKRIIPVLAGVSVKQLPDLFRNYAAVPFDRLDAAIHDLASTLAESEMPGKKKARAGRKPQPFVGA